MPRKKAVSRKKQTNSKSANATPRLENDFFAAPAKLAEQLSKDAAQLQSKQKKLADTVAKIQNQASKIEKSIAAAKKPTSASAKKQLLAAKKALNDTKKDYALSINALKAATQAVDDNALAHARAIALAKYLKNFDKEWAKQAKKIKDAARAKAAAAAKARAKAAAKAKAANKSRKKTKAKVKSTKPQIENNPAPAFTVIEQPQFDSYDIASDDSRLDETNKVAS